MKKYSSIEAGVLLMVHWMVRRWVGLGGSGKERCRSSQERSLVRVRYLRALDVRRGRGGGESEAIVVDCSG